VFVPVKVAPRSAWEPVRLAVPPSAGLISLDFYLLSRKYGWVSATPWAHFFNLSDLLDNSHLSAALRAARAGDQDAMPRLLAAGAGSCWRRGSP
jgi:hypothetical protein